MPPAMQSLFRNRRWKWWLIVLALVLIVLGVWWSAKSESYTGWGWAALAGVSAALLFVLGLLGDVLAAYLQRYADEALPLPDELLLSHDLTKLVGQTIGVVIEARAGRRTTSKLDSDALRSAAAKAPALWELLMSCSAGTRQPYAELSEPALLAFIRDGKRRALSSDVWQGFLAHLGLSQRSFHDRRTYKALLADLEGSFGHALRETLKHNWTTGGKVAVSIQLDFMSEVLQRLRSHDEEPEVQARIEELAAHFREIARPLLHELSQGDIRHRELVRHFDRIALWLPKPISQQELAKLLEQNRKAWFLQRYIPDLHVVGAMDHHLDAHMQTRASRQSRRRDLAALRAAFAGPTEHVRRLPRLPGFADTGGTSTERSRRVLAAGVALEDAVRLTVELDRRLRDGDRDLPPMQIAMRVSSDLSGPIDALREDLDAFEEQWHEGYPPTHECALAFRGVEALLGQLHACITREMQLCQPLALIGVPGVGKTHAVLAAADRYVAAGGVVLVIPARRVDASQELSAILSAAVDRPGVSAGAVLDALAAVARSADYRPDGATGAGEGTRPGPVLAMLAVDGLEEATNAHRWPERLTELAEMLASRPEIQLVCTARRTMVDLCLPPVAAHDPTDAWDFRHVDARADVPLREVFSAYAARYKLRVADLPWLPWALRTPLAIRLFVSLHHDQSIGAAISLTTSLPALIRETIEAVENELRRHPRFGWPEAEHVLLRALRAVIRRAVVLGEAVPHTDAVAAVQSDWPHGDGFMSRERVAHILDGCVTHGVLDTWRAFPRDRRDHLTQPHRVYEPAINSVTDYILALDLSEEVREAKSTGRRHELPKALLPRRDAVTTAVALLAADRHFVVQEGTWADQVVAEELATMQCAALLDLPPHVARPLQNWVANWAQSSMPACRAALGSLLVPAARIPGHVFGAVFLDGVLRPLRVADRDLFWSGPDYLPGKQGQIWTGRARWNPDDIQLEAEDAYNGLPLICAWLCSTVVRVRRAKLRQQLATWGAMRPSEMARLLEHVAATVNDGQVVEDVSVAAAGAAVRCQTNDPGLLVLATTAGDLFFADPPRAATEDALTRHAARVVIERAYAAGQAVSNEMLQRARPPYAVLRNGGAGEHRDFGSLLPIASDVPSVRSEDAHAILVSDLGWYVADYAIDGFFEQVEDAVLPETGDTGATPGQGQTEPDMECVQEEVLSAAAEGRLDIPTAILPAARAELESRRSRIANLPLTPELITRMSALLALSTPNDSPEGGDEPLDTFLAKNQAAAGPGEPTPAEEAPSGSAPPLITKNGEAEPEACPPEPVSRWGWPTQDGRTLTPEAQRLLAAYTNVAGLPAGALHPHSLRDAVIVAHVRSLGWDMDRFVGERGADGRLEEDHLGADVAISSRYRPATHGSHSAVAAFREKYVWNAVNTVAGHLADRLPRVEGYGLRRRACQVTDYGALGEGMPELFQGQMSAHNDGDDIPPFFSGDAVHSSTEPREAPNPWLPPGLLPSMPLPEGETQLARARHWIRHAPAPSVALWPGLGSALHVADRLVLFARIFATEPESMVDVALWVSAFAVAEDDLPLLRRDLKAGVFGQWLRRVSSPGGDGLTCTLTGGTYVGPSIAAWAPWIATEQAGHPYGTLDNAGQPRIVTLNALTAKLVWETADGGEASEYLPSPLLRDACKLADAPGTRLCRVFRDRQQQEVATYREVPGWGGFRGLNEVLSVNAGKARAAIGSLNMVPGWVVEIYHEVPFGLIQANPDGSSQRDAQASPGDRARCRFIVFPRGEWSDNEVFGPFVDETA